MEHRCYLCDPANPHRIVTYDGDVASLRIPGKFVGPPGRAHGGVSVASMMCPALRLASRSGLDNAVVRSVSGRLHGPVPLRTPITAKVTPNDGQFRVDLSAGEATVISGNVILDNRAVGIGDTIQEVPESLREPLDKVMPLADSELTGHTLQERYLANAAAAGFHTNGNVCFGCAETSEALQLFNREAPDGALWTRWQTDSSFIDEPGRLASAMIVAALDCSNLWVLNRDDHHRRLLGGKLFITGSFAVHFLRAAPLEMPNDYRVVARHLRTEGRKAFTMSVLLDEHGTPYAIAESTAILIDTPAGLLS